MIRGFGPTRFAAMQYPLTVSVREDRMRLQVIICLFNPHPQMSLYLFDTPYSQRVSALERIHSDRIRDSQSVRGVIPCR
jgi:hypothetical protein